MEQFLCSLAGIRSARVVALEPGTLDEIHVLCAPSLQPKQVVRNIESALCAGLGMRIDRRIVSVAQLRAEIETAPAGTPRAGSANDAFATIGNDADPADPTAPAEAHISDAYEPAPAAPAQVPAAEAERTAPPVRADRPRAESDSPRFLFVGYDSSVQGGRSTCRVTIRRGRQQFTGFSTGSASSQGRAHAAAAAVLTAVGDAAADRSLGLDGASIIGLGGQEFVLVSALGIAGRENTRLTGVAALVRSPEEAAILAGLQAANRWSESR